ncbi:DNA-binding protein Ikaros isoform X1 [Lates japonicus]|uniref:DNA-binding protein Ikaros isoform X1 n=1 Tax=Lates japonicus TaxID=270547 RepID=A0AAD3N918_LATJO|nr:DNA-binding protein Ikaros isoform X1 [Lates japonicus]
MAASNGLLGVSFYWHGTKQVPRARWLDSPLPQTRPVDKSEQNASAELRDIVMLGWNEEVQWRGEGLRAQLHGAAAALRPSAHGAGESWKNFILQTQGIAVEAPPPTRQHIRVSPRAICPEKKKKGTREYTIYLPRPPKLQMLKKLGAATRNTSPC